MKLIEEVCDFPSPFTIELKDEEELELIKEALDSFHSHLLMANKEENENNERIINQMMKVEEMCQELKIPGYEFS
jgi:hypothetical protein